MRHELKIYPEYFEKLLTGEKRFEVRNNDRNYQVGDTLCLLEWNPETKEYTGGDYWCDVTYILYDPEFVKDGMVVMGIRHTDRFWEERNPHRQAIERVIATFQDRFESALNRVDYNAASDWEFAINELKEVISNHEGEHESKQHIQSTQTEQVRSEENDR